MATWKCPDCGTVMLDSENRCSNPRCASNQLTGYVWHCRPCGHWNAEYLNYCEVCGREKPPDPRWARG